MNEQIKTQLREANITFNEYSQVDGKTLEEKKVVYVRLSTNAMTTRLMWAIERIAHVNSCKAQLNRLYKGGDVIDMIIEFVK